MSGPAISELAMLAADLRDRAFGPAQRCDVAPRLGAEVEFLALEADTHRVMPIDDVEGRGTLALLRSHGRVSGWTEMRTPKGTPAFRVPTAESGPGHVTFEPGGQVEYSSPPFGSASALARHLADVLDPLRAAAIDGGVELLALGVDPVNDAPRAPLQLAADRYRRMAEYFAALGPAGARMMRQTAAFQVNLDLGESPYRRWRLLEGLAPYLIAIFANSPIYAGEPTGHRSFRAATWRALDSSRTGLVGEAGSDAPVAEYLEFALCAPDMMRRTADGRWLPFCGWLTRPGTTFDDWETHLTTLFPEVRPRGWFEVRSMDAVELEWCVVPLLLLAGLVYAPDVAYEAGEMVRGSDADLLVRAGVRGLADPQLARGASRLAELSLAGCAALGPEFADPADLDVARAFFDRYTFRARSPADDVLEGVPAIRAVTP